MANQGSPIHSGLNTSWDLTSLPALPKQHSLDQLFSNPDVIQRVISEAKEMQARFVNGKLSRLPKNTNSRVILTRQQCASLLALMALKQIPKDWGHFTDFSTWIENIKPGYSLPSNKYLEILSQYFLELDRITDNKTPITFTRVRVEALPPIDKKKPFCTLNVMEKGAIGDNPDEAAVDFAHSTPCFGSGGTQEEIIFGMAPEFDVLPLLCDELGKGEAVIASPITKIAQNIDFGLDLKYEKIPENQKRDRTIIVMDAGMFYTNEDFEEAFDIKTGKAFRKDHTFKKQFSKKFVEQELLKAYAGFSGARQAGKTTIGTGHWGCGAFGGDPELKSLIQWCAASSAGIGKMNFYVFGDAEFQEKLNKMVSLIEDREFTPAKLQEFLLNNLEKKLDFNKSVSVFSLLEKHLNG